MSSTAGSGEKVGRRRTLRRVVLLGVPSLYVLLGLLHPTANPELGDETDLFIGLHVAQLFLIMGLGYVLWLLVDGVTNRAATLARALIIPFLVVYTALDAILGIAWGIAAEAANGLSAADQGGAGRLIEELISGDPDPRGLILYWGAGLLWLAVAVAVVAGAQGHSPARCPRVDGPRRCGVRARSRSSDGSGRDGVVPARHRVGRVPPPSGRDAAPGDSNVALPGGNATREGSALVAPVQVGHRRGPFQRDRATALLRSPSNGVMGPTVIRRANR